MSRTDKEWFDRVVKDIDELEFTIQRANKKLKRKKQEYVELSINQICAKTVEKYNKDLLLVIQSFYPDWLTMNKSEFTCTYLANNSYVLSYKEEAFLEFSKKAPLQWRSVDADHLKDAVYIENCGLYLYNHSLL